MMNIWEERNNELRSNLKTLRKSKTCPLEKGDLSSPTTRGQALNLKSISVL